MQIKQRGLKELSQPYIRKKIIILWSKWNRFLQDRCIRKNDLIVNSQMLFEDNKNHAKSVKIIRTTTLYEKDLYKREDTCKNDIVRLLYTGRIDRSKGLFEMVNALSLLINDGIKVELHFVGWASENDTIVKEILDRSSKKKINKFIYFHGYQPLGDKLFSFYKKSDIYLIASIGNEGFPRTIWEAMAHSLPVIATKIGSIPHFLSNERDSLLINPKSEKELFYAIKRIILDKDLRRKIIKNGFQLSTFQTLENRSKEFIEHIKNLSS